jgi:hypothetical protein
VWPAPHSAPCAASTQNASVVDVRCICALSEPLTEWLEHVAQRRLLARRLEQAGKAQYASKLEEARLLLPSDLDGFPLGLFGLCQGAVSRKGLALQTQQLGGVEALARGLADSERFNQSVERLLESATAISPCASSAIADGWYALACIAVWALMPRSSSASPSSHAPSLTSDAPRIICEVPIQVADPCSRATASDCVARSSAARA